MPRVRTPGIRLEGVALERGAHPVFEALSMRVTGKRWHAVLGRSGAGKSSLLRLIAALEQARSGSVSADDGEPLGPRVAYMAQDDGLLPWLSALENVRLGARLRGRRDDASRARARALLDRVGLREWADARPGTLSGGMRQRVALARTLFEDLPIVLMDEPFSRLDALTRDELQRLAATLLAGRTVVLVTHDPLEAVRLAHEVTLLRGDPQSEASAFSLDGTPPRDPEDPSVIARARALRSALAGEGEDSGASLPG